MSFPYSFSMYLLLPLLLPPLRLCATTQGAGNEGYMGGHVSIQGLSTHPPIHPSIHPPQRAPTASAHSPAQSPKPPWRRWQVLLAVQPSACGRCRPSSHTRRAWGGRPPAKERERLTPALPSHVQVGANQCTLETARKLGRLLLRGAALVAP